MLTFLSQALTHNRQVGAVLPSSAFLAREITRPLREHRGPRRILEVGPGTGAFTRRILADLDHQDSFHLVEINPAFARSLAQRYLVPYRRAHPHTEVVLHHGAIEDIQLPGDFDFIVCGLPFTNFESAKVRVVFRKMLDLLARNGELAYFEYSGPREVQLLFRGKQSRRRLRRVRAHEQWLYRRHQGSRTFVPVNLLPAFVVRLRADSSRP